jgi:hypothetical protein
MDNNAFPSNSSTNHSIHVKRTFFNSISLCNSTGKVLCWIYLKIMKTQIWFSQRQKKMKTNSSSLLWFLYSILGQHRKLFVFVFVSPFSVFCVTASSCRSELNKKFNELLITQSTIKLIHTDYFPRLVAKWIKEDKKRKMRRL